MPDSRTATIPGVVPESYHPARWGVVEGLEVYPDVAYLRQVERDQTGRVNRDLPCVRIAFVRPEVRNAFRPSTVDELYRVLDPARMTGDVGTVLLTGNGPSPQDGGWAFCSGGGQPTPGRAGYRCPAVAAAAAT
ncbi:1,4-dihydroxy-2-naphthoyl-CoA synthase, partial [Rothia kristinae]